MFYASGRDERYALSQGELRVGLTARFGDSGWPKPWEGCYLVTPEGCEIDRVDRAGDDSMPIQAAPVYPLTLLGGDAEKVRGNQHFRVLWLPGPEHPYSPFGEEMYADFGLAQPFEARELIEAECVGSLGDLAVTALQAQLVRYFSRSTFLETPPP